MNDANINKPYPWSRDKDPSATGALLLALADFPENLQEVARNPDFRIDAYASQTDPEASGLEFVQLPTKLVNL